MGDEAAFEDTPSKVWLVNNCSWSKWSHKGSYLSAEVKFYTLPNCKTDGLIKYEKRCYPMFSPEPCLIEGHFLVSKFLHYRNYPGKCLPNPCPPDDEVFLNERGICYKLTDKNPCKEPMSLQISLQLGKAFFHVISKNSS